MAYFFIGSLSGNAFGTNWGDTFQVGGGIGALFADDGYDTVSFSAATKGVTLYYYTPTTFKAYGGGSGPLIDIDLYDFERYTLSSHNDQYFGKSPTPKVDYVHAGDGDDFVRTYEGNDILFGGDGDDTLYGDEGHDQLWGGNDDDDMYGGSGNDYLNGGSGDDFIRAGGFHDVVDAGSGDDIVYGGTGRDSVTGGMGADDLYGGFGPDHFFFSRSDAYNAEAHTGDIFAATREVDIIHDFDSLDTIHLAEGLVEGSHGSAGTAVGTYSVWFMTAGAYAGNHVVTWRDEDGYHDIVVKGDDPLGQIVTDVPVNDEVILI